jgi:molecular chaperone DnaK
MTYMLGLDLGTTYTAAAVWRDGSAEMVALGTHSQVIPSVVHLRADGTLITGEAAVRRSLSDPGRTAREFKRRLGDPTPILLGGTPLAAVDLMTALLRDVLAAVSERHGGPPSAVALTHPANWGQFKIDLLRQAADACGLRDITLVTEPVAAAVDYAAGARVPVGEVVAVYDLGGGTFDAAVLRRTASGFETLGEPVGLERLGGIDFDHAVVAHVERSIVDTLKALDRNDPEVAGALTRLRHECVTAKEGLSEDSEVVVPVALPGVWSEVRLTRGEFEQMIAPALIEPLRAFRRGVASAGISASDIHTVLLVGGSSRVPLVAETVAGELGRPVAVDTHPKHAVALGAARIVGTKAPSTKPVAAATPAVTAAPAA